MEKFVPTCTDISKWSKKLSIGTGGTRKKSIYTSPESVDYFFKGSKQREDKTLKFPLEFWSEIVASKVGQLLGFELLDYNIGIDELNHQQVACLSENMVNNQRNRLSEGVDYLMVCNEDYNPSKTEYLYTYSFIKSTFEEFELKKEFSKFILMLLFDAIIGNSDRHQENWAFIIDNQKAQKDISKEISTSKTLGDILISATKMFLTFKSDRLNPKSQHDLIKTDKNIAKKLIPESRFSPIYDSGCCLGRELTDEKINSCLINDNQLSKYMNNGRAEVRIKEGIKKPTHLELVEYIKEMNPQVFSDFKTKLKANYDREKMFNLIENIDRELPDQFKNAKLPDNRKHFMQKILTLRLETILNIKG
jgi:hypothetical protein